MPDTYMYARSLETLKYLKVALQAQEPNVVVLMNTNRN